MKFHAGKLDTIIRIEKPTETQNQSGEVLKSWSLHFEAWAERVQSTASEKEDVEAMQRVSTDYTEWRIRYPMSFTLPTTKMKVIEKELSDEYDIENIRIEGRKDFLVLVTKQRQQR